MSVTALHRSAVGTLFVLTLAPGLYAAQAGGTLPDLKRLSVEELMQIDVTTTTRGVQSIGTTAAAISVITREEIRRSGVSTIADALRLAEGVHVARVHNSAWAISARGFNQGTANKLLVMVDGRTVYSPLFAGAFWNTVDYVLEDIERIEVIRGPGAALWGANAVNGVVNIITRSAHDTVGTYASLSSGTEDRGVVEARYGAGDAAGHAWRLYGKFADRDAQHLGTGPSAGDRRRRGQTGFRFDSRAGRPTTWLAKGDLFVSHDQLPGSVAGEFSELAFQARVAHDLAPDSRLSVQSYFRREQRDVAGQLAHHINIVDLDAQHSLRWAERHDIVWGGGFRVNWDDTEGGDVAFDPPSRRYQVSNVFVQDDITVVPSRFFTTVGVKWEHNAFSGGEIQPNVRARLVLAGSQVLWGAVSRAVRRPTRLEEDAVIRTIPGQPFVVGNDDFKPESLLAFEAGYRVRPTSLVSIDVAVFRHNVKDLRSQDTPPSGAPPFVIGNSLEGRSYGAEIGVNTQPRPWWRTHLAYTWLDTAVTRPVGSRDIGGGTAEANDPRHLFLTHSSFDVGRSIEIDAVLNAVGSLPSPAVPAYAELTLRAGWHATPATEIWTVGQDPASRAAPGIRLGAATRRRARPRNSRGRLHSILTMPRLAIAVALFFALPHGADAEVTLEYRVKAAYLFNFLKFVDWPATAPGGPFTICVAGRNPFENVLQDTIRGEQVNGRAVVSRVILEPEPGCHLVFMPQGSASAAYLRAAKGAPVLTVGEDRDFIGQGGMVSFYPEGSRIRFEVNPDAAAQAQLRVSSRLLQLARIVNDQESAP